jgi:Protein of unknown function (DUF4446)
MMVVFPLKTVSLLVVVALGLNALMLVVLAQMAARGRRRPTGRAGLVAMDDALRGVLEGHARSLQRLEEAIRQLGTDDRRLTESLRGAVQRVSLMRYDAFDDVGGRLSFSCALLNERGDGVVVTSINGRQDTRVYAKPVIGGGSDHNLSEEEEQAIRQALARPREKVEAT